MKWFRRGPKDLSLSNEYQQLTRGGCINCGALHEVLKAENIYNMSALRDILSKVPANGSHSGVGCWAYYGDTGYYPVCLAKLADDDPKVKEARDQIIRAWQVIKDVEEQTAKERAKRLRKIHNRALP
jgi:hypothetical protein